MPVQTRSQLKKERVEVQPLYEVDIDFDEASEAWKANKISIGNGSYRYACSNKSAKNCKCLKKCMPGEIYCKTHYKPL